MWMEGKCPLREVRQLCGHSGGDALCEHHRLSEPRVASIPLAHMHAQRTSQTPTGEKRSVWKFTAVGSPFL